MDETPSERDELAAFAEREMPVGMALLDAEGVVTAWNAAAARITGWPRGIILGRPLDLLYPEADRRAGKPAADRDAAAAGPVRDEGWRLRRDGTEFVAETILTRLDSGGYGLVIHDATDRRAGVHALEGTAQHLQSILATVLDAMIVIDTRGLILSFSAAAERMFGYGQDQVIGRNVAMLMPAADARRHDDYLDHYLDTGERRIIGIGRIVVGRRADGSEFPMELAVGEALSEGQRIFTGFIRDLSDKQRAELRLKQAQAELIHVSRTSAMGTMASTLAHELNQPLGAIANYLEAARDILDAGDADAEAIVRQALDEAAREALRAGDIVRRLRSFVARGDVERRIEPLAPLLEEAAGLAMLGARERGVRALFAFDPAAPTMLGDRVQIQQVVVNLVRNAVDSVGGSPVRDITIATSPDGGEMVRITVSDTGPGIAPDILPRLFQAFASTKQSGMGLGLSICRTIVEAHGGRIWAESPPGSGAAFHFTLPKGELGDD